MVTQPGAARELPLSSDDDAADAAYSEGLRHARAIAFPYGEGQLLHASGLLQRQRGNEAGWQQ